MRHAIIDPNTNKVINVVIWEGHEWQPPRNTIIVQHDTVDIGDLWDPNLKQIVKQYSSNA